jgi:hypothetical protein
MGEDALTEFMESEPSVAVIKSTTKALKSSMENGVGANSGKNVDNSEPADLYESCRVTSIDYEED